MHAYNLHLLAVTDNVSNLNVHLTKSTLWKNNVYEPLCISSTNNQEIILNS